MRRAARRGRRAQVKSLSSFLLQLAYSPDNSPTLAYNSPAVCLCNPLRPLRPSSSESRPGGNYKKSGIRMNLPAGQEQPS